MLNAYFKLDKSFSILISQWVYTEGDKKPATHIFRWKSEI